MAITPPIPPPSTTDRARAAGALWVAGTGAFLLFAAAAVFVAVRWEQIPASAKFAAIAAVTGACLTAGRRLRAELPATAAAVFHLGTLLIPIDVAAVGVRLGWTWPVMLLAQGATGTAVFPFAARADASVVLRTAAWSAVVVLAAGVGGTTGMPAAVALALVALAAASLAGRRPAWSRSLGPWAPPGLGTAATAWATVAGLAPALAAVERLGPPGDGVLVDLGLAGDASRWAAAAAGVIAGIALALTAHVRRSVPHALMAAASVVTGAAASWLALDPASTSTLIALATVAVVVEAGAWRLGSDPFWGPLARVAAGGAELGSAVGTLAAASVLLGASEQVPRAPQAGVAAALLGVAWLIAGVRRTGRALGWPAGLVGAAVGASAAAALAGGSQGTAAVGTAIAGATLALVAPGTTGATGATGTGRPAPSAGIADALPPAAASAVELGLVAWAPIVANPRPLVAAGVGVGGALALAVAAVRVDRRGHGPDPERASQVTVHVIAALWSVAVGLGPLAVDAWAGSGALAGEGRPAPVAAVGTLWLVAAIVARCTVSLWPTPVAAIPRLAGLAVLVVAPVLPAHQGALLAATIAALALGDAVRRDEPPLALGASAALPVALAELAVATGWTAPEAGVIVAVSAAVWLGLGAVVPSTAWTPALAAGAAVSGALGLLLALGDPTAAANAAIVVGGLLTAVGLGRGRAAAAAVGGGLATLGIWAHLGQAGATALEPYAAPVALLLLAVGWLDRRERQTSSWVAYGPAIGLLGGGALAERLSGAAGWHALVAGAVAAVAVAVGGARRLAGPLLGGTALLVGLVIEEKARGAAGAPTWMWLAAGGTALLASGVVMERRGVGPVEGGRRLVDIVREGFA